LSKPDTPEPGLRHRETAKRGAFHLGEGAEMTYTRPTPGVMKVNHTLVDKAHRGRGLAHQLYSALVDFARANDRRVLPVCPFVVAMFEQHPEDADLLATGQ
jgi:predicted GNAT family acetyltransferase